MRRRADLLKHTPTSHPDHPLLQDALCISQNFLSSINEEITPRRQSMTVKKGEVLRGLRGSSFDVNLVNYFLFPERLTAENPCCSERQTHVLKQHNTSLSQAFESCCTLDFLATSGHPDRGPGSSLVRHHPVLELEKRRSSPHHRFPAQARTQLLSWAPPHPGVEAEESSMYGAWERPLPQGHPAPCLQCHLGEHGSQERYLFPV
nr:uncharacterized protein LOC120361040 [Saimiri boliviensis boliviensis]